MPKRLTKAQKATQLSAVRLSDGGWRIFGDSGEYIVYLDEGYEPVIPCTCVAASYGKHCSHILSAILHAKQLTQALLPSPLHTCITNEEKDNNMATATARRYSPDKPSSNFEAQQPHLVDDGFYFGFFRKYSEPKLAKKFDGSGMERKVFVSFLLTHGMNEQRITTFTEAGAYIPYKWFYSDITGMSSKYFDFEYALVGNDYSSKEDLFNASEEKRKDFDGLVGRPALLEIARWSSPKTGMQNLGIQSFKTIPKTATKTLGEMYKTFQFGFDDKELKFIKSPMPVYAENGSSSPQYTGHGYSEQDDSEIPF